MRAGLRRHLAAILCLVASAAAAQPVEYDLVIANGRVIEPESAVDAIRHVGVAAGKVAALSETPLRGKTVLDASGLVVAPGFVDLHSHAQTVPSDWMHAFDGVTTALELEAGVSSIAASYEREAAGGRPLNFGFSASWSGLRRRSLGARWLEAGSAGEVAATLALVEAELKQGALGIGMLLGYAPATDRSEFMALARLGASYGVPLFLHVRGGRRSFEEAVEVAEATGAHIHLCHINSSALRQIEDVAQIIQRAQDRGLRVSAEAYPWGAASTVIGAPFLSAEGLKNSRLQPSDIVYLRTGERPKTQARLDEIRRADPLGLAIIHYLDDGRPTDWRLVETALLFRDAVFATDAMPYTIAGTTLTAATWPLPEDAVAHPRGAATFTRVLGRLVREERALSLAEAIRRSTFLPARIAEAAAPDMRRKGRLSAGADADIVVFDPAVVNARATHENPRLPSVGMRHVLVNGEAVIRDGELVRDARPGRPVRAPPR